MGQRGVGREPSLLSPVTKQAATFKAQGPICSPSFLTPSHLLVVLAPWELRGNISVEDVQEPGLGEQG